MNAVVPNEMKTFLLVTLVAVAVIGVAIAVAVVLVRRYRQRRFETIQRESMRLAGLRIVNRKIDFAEIGDIDMRRDLDSKQKFDRFDPYAYLMVDLDEDQDYYIAWIEGAKHNRQRLEQYQEALAQLPASTYARESWRRIEDELFQQEVLHPATAPSVFVWWGYTSPAGRNSYGDVQEFTFNQVIRMLNEAREMRAERGTRQATIRRERAMMTPGLRYDVMKRDGFRCVLCGSQQSDGVKLEVDHIVPVSRGGKTEMSNLRTLCDRCNRGKSDKA